MPAADGKTVKVRCRCPSCSGGTMWLVTCDDEPDEGVPGLHCRGCGAEWALTDVREIAEDYQKALKACEDALGAEEGGG